MKTYALLKTPAYKLAAVAVKELQIAFNVWSISFDNLKAVEQSGGVVWNVFN